MEKPFLADSLQKMTAVFDDLLSSLSTLQQLGNLEIHLLDEKTLLRQVLGTLVDNYGVERCSVFLLEGDRLTHSAGLEWKEWEKGDAGAPVEGAVERCFEPVKYLMNEAIRTGEPKICPDARTDPRFGTAPPAGGTVSLIRQPLACVISAPIKAGGETLGVLNLSHPEPGFFNEWHERLVPLFSSFLGQILTAHRLLRRLEDEVGERTRQLETILQDSRKLQQHYRNLSLVDELTGLYNRRFFFAECRRTLGRSIRYRRPFALLLLDLDSFKKINDTHGHGVGDMVLRDVAGTLLAQVRETDILARVGGEEFAIALPETQIPEAEAFVERLLKAVRNLRWVVDERAVRVSLSIGLAGFSTPLSIGAGAAEEVTSLLDRLYSEADRRMYDAKRKGGDQASLEG